MGLFAATTRLLRRAVDDVLPDAPSLCWAHALASGWKPDEPGSYCPRCGATVAPGAAIDPACGFCRGQRQPWDRLVRLGPYRDPLPAWVVAMKFQQSWKWAEIFGRELASRIEASPAADAGPRVAVCPVPMHFIRRLSRGYNQAGLMADALAAQRGWPCAPILRRVRHAPSQTAVARSSRRGNIRGTFALGRVDIAGWHIWLVDDVKTTGATLNACTRLLREAGAASVNIAVAAVADPRELHDVREFHEPA
ncbi:MAG: ComF family protein [Planctomycetota bacterium]|nr:ComF family protein [Planctomycetota bacterium]